MAKDPAFLFYSSDFLSGVSDLTMEERGQYITLLCLQHQKGGKLSRKAVAIAVPNATADVMAKFKEDEEGMYINERLEKECIKRREHSEKQRQRALDGWQKRKAKKEATVDATALPLENENENVIKDVIVYLNNNTNKSFKHSSEKSKSLIKARLKDGYTLDDFKKVIDIKCKSWLNDENMAQYLRPETLFSNKFEGYLNEVPNSKPKLKNDGIQRFKIKYRHDIRTHIHTEEEIKAWCIKYQTEVSSKYEAK